MTSLGQVAAPADVGLDDVRFEACPEYVDTSRSVARTRGGVTTILIVGVLSASFLALFSWINVRHEREDARWVTHTQNVLKNIQDARINLTEEDTGAQGFSLSGYELFLKTYEAGRNGTGPTLATLKQLTSDNPNQQMLLGVLQRQVTAKFEADRLLVDARKLNGAVPTVEQLGQEKLLWDSIHTILRESRSEERRLLYERTLKSQHAANLTILILLLSSFSGIGFLMVAGAAIYRQMDANARANCLNAELSVRVKQRTDALQFEIAERKTALKELADQKFALDQHGIVAITDVKGTITYVNGKFCAISKYSETELLGQNHRILNSGRHSREFFRQMYHVIASGQVWHGEIQNRAKDGSLYWMATTIVPFMTVDGKLRQYVAIRADITERKKAEEILHEQSQILDLAQVMVRDMESRIVLWNLGAQKLYGFTKEEAVGRNSHELLRTEFPVPISRIEAELHRTGTWEGELTHRKRDGRRIVVSSLWVLHRDVGGKPTRVMEANVDITIRKQAEKLLSAQAVELERHAEEVLISRRSIQTLNDQLEQRVTERTAQLEAANHELEAFSYSVSHDLRAPLRHIAGFSQILSEEFGSSLPLEASSYLARIQSGTQKMGVLIDELLNLARLGRHAMRPESVCLDSIVKEAMTILQPDLTGRQVELVFGDLPTVECDPVLVKQIFQNLLSNALKFTRARERAVIEVHHRQEHEQSIFVVRDNGIGFDMKYVDKLFGVFQRLHRAEDFEGTGIGLATVQRLVQKHGGRVWAEGQLDRGATFQFTLGMPKVEESKAIAAGSGGQ